MLIKHNLLIKLIIVKSMPEREGGIETPQQRFEREVVEPTKKAMKEAMSQATSKDDAIQKIKEALPKDYHFIGPLVRYTEEGDEKLRSIQALVSTLDYQDEHIDIEEFFDE
jgi:hypothetical protein